MKFRHLSPGAEPCLQVVEIDIDNRRNIKRQKLGEKQSAHDSHPQRAAYLASGAKSEGYGKRAHECSHGRHHDRAEPYDRPLEYGLRRLFALCSLYPKGEVYHHDGVLLHDTYQHDDPD